MLNTLLILYKKYTIKKVNGQQRVIEIILILIGLCYNVIKLIYRRIFLMTDTNLLKSKMALHGYKNTDLAKALDITSQMFSNKLNNSCDRSFTFNQVKTIKELLHLSPEEVEMIFFS